MLENQRLAHQIIELKARRFNIFRAACDEEDQDYLSQSLSFDAMKEIDSQIGTINNEIQTNVTTCLTL